MWNLKYSTNKAIYKIERGSWRSDLWLLRWGTGRGMEWGFGIGRYKLSHLEWLNHKVLLYTTRNYYPISWDKP